MKSKIGSPWVILQISCIMSQTCTNSLVQDSDAEIHCEKGCHLTKCLEKNDKKSCQIVAQTKTDQVRQKSPD